MKPEPQQVSYKVIAMASGSGAVQAGEDVAHILSDDIEIADPADLIEISTEGITEAVVLERSVDVVLAGPSRHQQSQIQFQDKDLDSSRELSTPRADKRPNILLDQVTTSASEVPVKGETPRTHSTRTRRASLISRKMNTRAQSLYEATVEAAKDLNVTSAEPFVSTCREEARVAPVAAPASGASDAILPDQVLAETDEDIAVAVQSSPDTRKRRAPSQPEKKDATKSNYTAEDGRNPGNGFCSTRGQRGQRYQQPERRKRSRGGLDGKRIAQETGETTTTATAVGGEGGRQAIATVPMGKAGRTRRMTKAAACQEVKQESEAALELIQDLKEMDMGEQPSTKRRRGGPRRRCPVPSKDSEQLPTSMQAPRGTQTEQETPKKPAVDRKRKSRKSCEPGAVQIVPGNFECGKCATTCETERDFLVHAAVHHGGLARKSGDSQEFSEDEMQAAIRLSFTRSPSVACYKCVSKKFTSQLGLNYHLGQCGKTKEELEVESHLFSRHTEAWIVLFFIFFLQAAKTPCPFKGCGYRGFTQNL